MPVQLRLTVAYVRIMATRWSAVYPAICGTARGGVGAGVLRRSGAVRVGLTQQGSAIGGASWRCDDHPPWQQVIVH